MIAISTLLFGLVAALIGLKIALLAVAAVLFVYTLAERTRQHKVASAPQPDGEDWTYMPEFRPTVNRTTHKAYNPVAMVPGILARTAILALLWWLIAQGQVNAWLIGLPAVALAAMASIYLGRAALPGISLVGLSGFIALFLRESARGGLDVARRTLAPKLRIQPGFKNYRLQLNDPSARVLMINCISLLPGTLAARLDGDHVEIHLLDAGEDPDPDLRRLEQAIARLFGLPLEITDV